MATTRKTTPTPASPHWFRLKHGRSGTEFEGQGLGLIPAVLAVVLVIAVASFLTDLSSKVVSKVWDHVTQPTPATPVRPPPG